MLGDQFDGVRVRVRVLVGFVLAGVVFTSRNSCYSLL